MLRHRTDGAVFERNRILQSVMRSQSTPVILVESKMAESGNVAADPCWMSGAPMLEETGGKADFKFVLLNQTVCPVNQRYCGI